MRNIYYNKINGGMLSRTLFPETQECQFVVVTAAKAPGGFTVDNISDAYSFDVVTVKTIDIYYDYDAKYSESSIYLRQGIGTERCPLGRDDFLSYSTLSKWICELKAVCACSRAYLRIFCRGNLPHGAAFSQLSSRAIITSWNASEKIVFDVDPLESSESSEVAYNLDAFIVDANVEICEDIILNVAGIFNSTVMVGRRGELEVSRMYNCTIESKHNGSESEFVIYKMEGLYKNITCIDAVHSITADWVHTVNISAPACHITHACNSTIHMVCNSIDNPIPFHRKVWRDVNAYLEYSNFLGDIINYLTAKNCSFTCKAPPHGERFTLFYSCYLQDCDISLNIDGQASYGIFSYHVLSRCCYGGEIIDCKIRINGDIHFPEASLYGQHYGVFCYCFDYSIYENCSVEMNIGVNTPPFDANSGSYLKQVKVCDDRQNNDTCHICTYVHITSQGTETISNCAEID